ncbi:MAG: hypothetical protein AAFP90_00675, partial [Planctomycetota bacterium]
MEASLVDPMRAAFCIRDSVSVWPVRVSHVGDPSRPLSRIAYRLGLGDKNRFFEIGIAEYTFLSLLPHHPHAAGALAESANRMRGDALSTDAATHLLRVLLAEGMIVVREPRVSTAAAASSMQDSAGQGAGAVGTWIRNVNPFWMQIPLLGYAPLRRRVHQGIDAVAAVCWPFSHPIWFVALILLGLLGLWSVAM